MRVVVAMSGGVDSSAAAALLKEQGHEVIGITLRVWSYEGNAKCGSCCSPDDIDDARAVAQTLGIPFYVANAEEIFQDRVVNPFVQSYLGGKTPIPCVSCNRDVKFNFLLKRARALGARLATGHYAQVEEVDGRFHLRRAVDAAKDQSYFLFTLGQEELKDVLFPVGHLTKTEVRAVAERHHLPTTHKPESMEICFVPDGDYAGFVEKVAGPQPSGEVVDPDGKVLGTHNGIHRFTVGQRKGLNLGGGEVRYVQRLEPETNRVVVGPAEGTGRAQFGLLQPHWVDGPPPPEQAVEVRIRHRHAGAPGRIHISQHGLVSVKLDAPARAVTPGQAAVVYDRDRVLGGGWIV
ncbi:tRNA 2-thiouridine(34) synthase MnmA [Corallococcus exercitus]|uniref:tRNA 2-thiouridine(34) synthase MnmA n=1 Tax=Corallococcus exercitus TaxID=2316736 RepID=UPI0035D4EE87